MALPADSPTRLLNSSASSLSALIASAASSVVSLNRANAETAAATTVKTSPSGLALTAMLNRSIASFAERIDLDRDKAALTVPQSDLDRDKTALTVPQIFFSLCAAATAMTAALYAPYVAMTVRRTFPTVSQFSIRVETRPRASLITPSFCFPISLNIVSIASSIFEICPVML